jgi:hypothetical protein
MTVEAPTVLETPTEAAIRDELQHLVLADLHGPLGGENEEFGNERPTDRYIVGRLAPDGTVIEPDTQDDSADSDAADLGEDPPEPSAPNIVSLAPSAMGCTVYVAGDTTELLARAEWAWYRRTVPETETEQLCCGGGRGGMTGTGWCRYSWSTPSLGPRRRRMRGGCSRRG